MIRTIGILGGKGMLGSDLVEFLGNDFETTAIDKDNYDAHRGKSFDVLINANGNSRRFWGNQNPREDFSASVVSVYDSMRDFTCGMYVYISSVDVYEHHESPQTTREDEVIHPEKLFPYGFHKYLAEQIVHNYAKKFLILRPSAMLGTKLKKGPFYDMLAQSPLFITADSRLQAISTVAVAQIIGMLLRGERQNEVFNVGGKGAFEFREFPKFISKPVGFRPDAERQVYEMNTEKIQSMYGELKTSEEYVREFLSKP